MIKVGETKINKLPLGSSDIPRICLGDTVIFQKIVQYLTFVDPEVESICATNWGDGTGITAEEAAKVTSLGASTFQGNTNIVSFKELLYFTGLTSITGIAFKNCTRLTTIGIPKNITSVPANVFQNATSVSSIYIEDLDKYINIAWASQTSHPFGTSSSGGNLYLNNTAVTSVSFPTGTTAVKAYCMYRCKSLTSITLPNTITSIGNSAFSECSGIVGVLTFPSSLQTIGGYAFYGCSSITGTLTIPSTCTSLGGMSFRYCSGLTKLDLPANVSLGKEAFRYCSGIEEITFRGIFTETDSNVFNNATAVNKLNISSFNDYLSSTIMGYGSPTCVTNSDVHVYIISTGVEITSITIPNGTTSIDGERFRRWAYVTSITIPNTVTSIGNGAFAYCSGITGDLVIPSSVTSIGGSAFTGCSGITNLTVPAIWSNTIYNGCGNGTGTFTLNGDLTLSGTFRANTLQFENIVFNGDVDMSIIANNIFISDAAEVHCVKSIRFLGDLVANYSSSGVYHTYSTTKSLEFIEVLGEMTNVKLLYGNNELVSGAIMHLGYSGVAGTPTQIMAGGAAKIDKIYVDSQAVIDAYAADTDWAAYSSKLDLWSNYNGIYKT